MLPSALASAALAHERSKAMLSAEMIRSKIATLAWYLERPSLYRELLRRVARLQMTTKRERERAHEEGRQGREWCEARQQPQAALFSELGIEGYEPFAEAHAEVLQAAHEAVERAPVKMGGPASMDLLYALVRYMPAQRVVETGVASGWSSLAVLTAFEDNGRGRLISTDMPYAKMDNEAWVGCAVPAYLRARWTLLRLPDRDGLPKALDAFDQIDLVHHDSDKSYAGRKFVYERSWPKIRAGGLLLTDDVEDNLAFRDFAEHVNRSPFVFQKKPGNFCGALIK